MTWRVLVIDANEKYRTMMKRSLTIWGYLPEVVADGQSAVDMLAQEKDIFLVLVDWHLPEKTGEELCRDLRDMIPRPLFLIALNGRVARSDVANALKAGINGYLTKPVPLLDLECLLGQGRGHISSTLNCKQGTQGKGTAQILPISTRICSGIPEYPRAHSSI